MPRLQHEIVIDASLERVFETIVDYESYPEFVPHVLDAEVLERDGDRVQARFELEIVLRVPYTLVLEERAPQEVSWQLLGSPMLKANEGRWLLEAIGAEQTRAQYELEVALRGRMPQRVTDRLTDEVLPRTLQAFKRRAESGS